MLIPEKEIQEGLEAKRLILEDLGVAAEKISRINTVADADLMIEYLEKKASKENTSDEGNNEKDPEKDKMIKLKANMGKEFKNLPPPEEVKDKVKMNFLETMNPKHVKHAYNNKSRWGKTSRILIHFNDETGQPEVF